MNTAPTTRDLIDLSFRNWEDTHTAHLDAVPRTATVGQVLADAVQALQLPLASFYKALWNGRELNHGETLDEAGIRGNEQLEIVPEVSAG